MVMTFASEKEALIYLWHAGYIPWPNHLPRREGQYVKIRCEPTGPVTIEHIEETKRRNIADDLRPHLPGVQITKTAKGGR